MHRPWLVPLVAAALAAACRTSAPSASGGAEAETVRYVYLLGERAAGEQITVRRPGGVREITFRYNDRGRGPDYTRRLALGADGAPVSSELAGVDYLKTPVEERFRLDGRHASWKGTSESGEAAVDGAAFFVTLYELPEEPALLAQALLRAPGGRMRLLPSGEAALERVGELELRGSAGRARVTQYAISGLDFEPVRVWLDERGELFAQGFSWAATIREGWEASLPELLRAQREAAQRRAQALERTLARRPPGPLAFVHARAFDAERAAALPGTTVVVAGDRIERVGRDGEVPIPAGAEVVDASGKTLLPGLWDMHVHLAMESDALLHLAAGVTTVRDMGNDLEESLERRGRYDAPSGLGPRMLLAGFLDGPGPYTAPTKVVVGGADEARAVVDRYAGLHYDQIKVYSSVDPALVPVIAAEAHRLGLRVSGHVPAFMTAAQAVRDGFDELNHVNFLFLNFLPDVKDTRTPARFTAVAENAAALDQDSTPVREFVRLLAERRVVVDPTVNLFEEFFTARPGEISPGFRAVVDRLPVQVARQRRGGGLPVPAGLDARYRESFRAMLALVARLHRAGVPLVAGTDSIAGFALHRELELYAESGIPAPEVLRMATLGAARVMRRDGELGSIAPGKIADLVLVDGDPLSRIGDVRRTALVVKGGTLYDPRALYAAAGVH